MRRENRLHSYPFLGRNIWDSPHRDGFRNGVYPPIDKIPPLQHSETPNCRPGPADRRLFDQALPVYII